MRQKACEEINKMFGLNISVDYKEDYRIYDQQDMMKSESETTSSTPKIVDTLPTFDN